MSSETQHGKKAIALLNSNSVDFPLPDNFVNGELVELSNSSLEYNRIYGLVHGYYCSEITKICRVDNSYLHAQFTLHCEEYKATNSNAKIKELFHATSEYNIPSIIKNNLDRRLCKRVKFGKGVSFSDTPSYANKQSNRRNGQYRAMIVADVMVGSTCGGHSSMLITPKGYDTSTGNGTFVYVKYFDDEFYPKYVAFYTSTY